MIQKEWNRVFGTRTMLFVILLFLVIDGVLLVFSEQKSRPYSAEVYGDAWVEVDALLRLEDTQSVLGRLDRHCHKLDFLEFFVEFGIGELYEQAERFGAEAKEGIQKMMEEEYPEVDIPVLMAQYRAGEMVRHTDRPSEEQQLYEDIATELRDSVSYSEFRQTLVEDASRMLRFSVFAKLGTFGYRNVEATLYRYQNLPEIETVPTPAKSVAALFRGSVPGVLSLFFLLYLCIPLYLSEKEEGTIRLTRTCVKGRKALAGTKLAVFLLGAFFMQLLLFGVRFLVLEEMYGFTDLSRSIQSVSGFSGCVLPVTIGEYFLLLFLYRYAVLCLCAIVIAFFCTVCSGAKKAYGSIGVFWAVQAACYYAIPATASCGALHFLNLWGMLRFDAVGSYLNLNLFGSPVSCLEASVIVLGVGGILFTPIVVRMYCKKPVSETRREKKKIRSFPVWNTTSVFLHEGKKLFFDQKVVLILFVMLVVQVARYGDSAPVYSVDEVYYEYYMEILSGPLTSEKEVYLEKEALRYRALHEEDSTDVRVQKALNAERGFEKAYNRYLHIKSIGEGEFFYDTGYRYLLAEENYKTDILLMVTAVLLLMVTAVGLFCTDTENGMFSLLTTTRDGREGIKARLFLGGILTVMIWLLVYLPDFAHTLNRYGAEGMSAPARSVDLLAEAEHVLLWEYLAGIYLSRLLGLLVVSGAIYLFAYFTKSTAVTFFGATAVFLIPPLLSLLSERMNVFLFPYAPFSGNLLRWYPWGVRVFLIMVYALFVFLSYKFMINRKRSSFLLVTSQEER